MWKKEETPPRAPAILPERQAAPVAPPAITGTAAKRGGERASIGRSIFIRGDVTGDEDLLIQGHVEGSISLMNHALTIGPEGEVKASVTGRVVIVEGTVEGDIHSDEQVVLRASARVRGDIIAPRLVLEDGARFRGGVDMGEVPGIGAESETAPLLKDSGRASASGAENSSANGAVTSAEAAKSEESSSASRGTKKGSPELFAEART